MSQTIDNKAVEIDFRNKRFEQNVSTSLSSIEKLKKSLNFDGMAKGFDDLGKSASNLNFSSVGDAIETVKVRFSALQVFAVSAIKKISDAAIDMGVNLVKSMGGVENITAGWDKFAQKTQSVGTLIAQGYDMSTVEDQLGKLAWFTDETSFEFNQMVESIAKFTAAGQTLPDSVESLMGIANWAALSGQNAQTASRAMYQLSQAMGSGVMRKEDYKSIQNVSMDTVEFRQRALDAAVALGTLKKNADGTYTSIAKGGKSSTFTISQFADHLTQEAWFTSDVMKSVYTDYAGAIDKIYEYVNENGGTASDAIKALSGDLDEFQIKAFKAAQEARTWNDTLESVKEAVASTWMQTFEIIFGNYEEAKELWTDLANELYDVFAEPGNARNELLGEGLKSTKPFLNSYFRDTFDLSEEATDAMVRVGEKYGWASEEFDNYIAEISKGDPVMQNLIKGFYQIQEGATTSNESVRLSSESLLSSVSNYQTVWTKNKTITEENAAKLREVGDAYGYDSHQMNSLLRELYGTNYYTIEVTRNMLKAGAGLETITETNIDEYLKSTNGLTDEQIGHLKELQNQYGSNSEELNEYLKSLNKFDTQSRLNIMGVLGLAKGLSEVSGEIEQVDLEGYIRKLSGATEDQTSELVKFYEAQKESASSVEDYVDVLAKEDPILASRLKNYIRSNKEIDPDKIKQMTGATEKEVDALIKLIGSEEKNTKVVDDMIKAMANGDPVVEESIRKMLTMNDEIADLTGRQNLLSAFWSLWEYGGSILGTVKKAFENVFPSITSERLYEITKNIRNFAEGLVLSEENAKKLEDAFSGLFSIFKIVGQVGNALILQPIRDLFGLFSKHSGSVLDTAANWGQWIKAVADSGEAGRVAQEIYSRFKQVIKEVVDFFKEFVDVEKIAETYNKNGGGLAGVIAVIKEKAEDLGELFKDVFKIVTGTDFSDFSEKIQETFESAIAWVDQFLPEGLKISEIFETIGEVIDKVKDWLGFGKDEVETDGIEKVNDLFDKVKTSVKESNDNLQLFGDRFKGVFDIVMDVWDKVESSGIIKGVSGLIKTLTNNFFNLKPQDVAATAEAAAGAFVGYNVGQLVKDIRAIPQAIKALPEAIKSIPTTLSSLASSFKNFGLLGENLTKAIADKQKINKIKVLAESILMLAGAIFIISKVDPQRLDSAVWSIAGLITTMTMAFVVMEKTSQPFEKGMKQSGGNTLLKMAVSILLLTRSITKIADVEPKKLWNAVGVIAALAAVLAGAQFLMSKAGNGGKMVVGSIGMLFMSGAIIALAMEIGKLAEATDPSKIDHATMIVESIAVTLAACETMMSKLGGSGGKMIVGSMGAVALAAAIIIVAKTIEELTAYSGKMDEAWLVVEAIALTMSFAVTQFGNMNSGKSAIAGAVSSVILAAAIGLVGRALAELSKIDASALEASVFALGIMTAAIGAFVYLTGSLGDPKSIMAAGSAFLIASVGVVALAVALGMAAETLKGLSELSDSSFTDGIIRLLELMGSIAAFVGVISVIGILVKKVAPGFLILGAAMLAMAASVVVLGIGLSSLAVGISTLGPTMVLFGGTFMEGLRIMLEGATSMIPLIALSFTNLMIAIVNNIAKGLPLVRQALKDILIFGIETAMDVLTESSPRITEGLLNTLLATLAALNAHAPELIDQLLTLVESLLQGVADHAEGLVDKVMQIIINVINGVSGRIPELVDSLVGLVEALFNGLVQAMQGIGIEDISAGVTAVEDILLIMTLLSGANLLTATAMTGILGIASVVAELMLVLAALGGIAQIPGLDWLISEGGNILELIGIAIGKFLGGIAGGAIEGVSAGLPGLGTNLSAFMENAKGFIEGASKIDGSVSDGVSNLTSAILSLLGTEFLSVLGQILTLGFGDDIFAEQLKSFAKALIAYSDEISKGDFNSEKLNAANEAAEALAGLQSCIQPIGGVISWFTGRSDLGTFGENAAQFAEGMVDYVNAVMKANIGPSTKEKMDAMNSAAEALSGLQKNLSPIGGVITWFTGRSDLGTFGENAAQFAEGMVDYVNAVMKANIGANTKVKMDAMNSAAEALSGLQKNLSPIGGVVSWFAGRSDLGTFGENAAEFAQGMVDYVLAVTKANIGTNTKTKMDAMNSAAEALAGLQKHLDPIGGVVTWFTGRSDLGTFGESAADFGTGMSSFIDSIKDVPSDTTSIQSVIDISTKLVELQKTVKPIGGIASLFEGFSSLAATGLDFAGFGLGLKGFIDALNLSSDATKKIDNASKITTAISSLMSATPKSRQSYNLMKDNWTGVANAVKDFVTTWSSIGDGGFDNLAEQAGAFVEAIQILLGAEYGTNGELPGVVEHAQETVDKTIDTLDKGGDRANREGHELMNEYDSGAGSEVTHVAQDFEGYVGEIGDSAVNESDRTAGRMDESIRAWGREAVAFLEANGYQIDEAVKKWGKVGIEYLTGDEIVQLFQHIPVEWIDKIIDAADPKSKELYTVLRKIATDGGKNLTTSDILTIYKNGGISMIQSLIDGGRIKAEDVQRSLKEAIMNGITTNGGALDPTILKAYFELGGKLDKELAAGIVSSGSELGKVIEKAARTGAGSLSISDLLTLYKNGGIGLVKQVGIGVGQNEGQLKAKVEAALKNASNSGTLTKDIISLAKALGINFDENTAAGMSGNTVKNKAESVQRNAAAGAKIVAAAEGYLSGEAFGDGVAAGIAKKAPKVNTAARKLAVDASKAFNNALVIRSPSRVMMKSGEYFAEGFIVGLDSMQRALVAASGDSAKSAVDGFTNALSGFSAVDLDSIGDGLTIRPVMDLSDVQNGVSQIGSMMDGLNGHVIDGSLRPAFAAEGSMSSFGRSDLEEDRITKFDQALEKMAKRPPKQITQHFTIVSDDPEEVYEYVSSRMNEEVEREEAPWA